MDDWTPETKPDGDLTPPPRVPPVAVATSAPLPPRRLPSASPTRFDVRRLLAGALDRLDEIGDGIAKAVGIR